MHFSLKNRVALAFISANLFILVVGFTIFYYLDSLNKNIASFAKKSDEITKLTDLIRIDAVTILKQQRIILTNPKRKEVINELSDLCDEFTSKINALKQLYNNKEIVAVIGQMIGYVNSLKQVINKASLYSRDNRGLKPIGDIADQILESFADFLGLQYELSEKRDEKIEKIIQDTKSNMMMTLIITFLGTIVGALIAPGKISLPFKKINDAIRELQECNFDVSIYYNERDEIGEIANEMNKMISGFKRFEELRADRISIERRKFDVLANMVKRYILVVNARGEVVNMNSRMYSFLQLQSDEVMLKKLSDTLIPDAIKNTFDLALKRRSKIENAEVNIELKGNDENSEESNEEESIKDFKGYASIIPIRGKESSLDYYLMVMSKEFLAS